MIRHVILATAVVAAPATVGHAAIYDVEITGVLVGDGYDNLNIFDGALTGTAAFTALFSYDTEIGVRSNMINGNPADAISGNLEDLGSPVTASLRIGNKTHIMQSDPSLAFRRDNSSALVQPNYAPGESYDFNWAVYLVNAEGYDEIFNYSEGGWLRLDVYALLGSLPDSLEAPYSLSVDSSTFTIPYISGSWYFATFDRAANTGNSSFSSLRGDKVTVYCREDCTIAPVPLPAGLPLLVVALGSFALLRRRVA